MGCLKLNIENPTTLKVFIGGKSTNIKSRESVYLYGYQGSEKDDEIKGNGNSYTTEFRMLDPRLGRWLSTDLLGYAAAGWSPYRAFFDNPIIYTDKNGLFEKRSDAKAYKKENGIKGRIKNDRKAGEYRIDDKKNHTSYSQGTVETNMDQHRGDGVGESALISSKQQRTSGGPNFFGIDYNAIAKNKGNHDNNGPTYSVWNKDYQEYCKNNKAMQASAKHWNSVEVGLLKFELTVLTFCFGGEGLIEQGIMNGTVNFLSQTASKNGEVGEVDGAGVAIATFSGLIPGSKYLSPIKNKCLNVVTSSAIDGMVDVNFKGEMGVIFINKDYRQGVNDLVWNSLSGFAGIGADAKEIPGIIGQGMPTFLGTMINESTNNIWFPNKKD